MTSPLLEVAAAELGSTVTPLPGISAKIVNDHGNALQPDIYNTKNATRYLVLDQPWLSTLRSIEGNPERYRNTYWFKFGGQSFYSAEDGTSFDPTNAIWILGRIDDVMDVSGHCIYDRRGGAGARRSRRGRRGGGGRRYRRHQRSRHLRVRHATGQLRGPRRDHPTSCASRWPRNLTPSPG